MVRRGRGKTSRVRDRARFGRGESTQVGSETSSGECDALRCSGAGDGRTWAGTPAAIASIHIHWEGGHDGTGTLSYTSALAMLDDVIEKVRSLASMEYRGAADRSSAAWRIKKHIYPSRTLALADIASYIGDFCNRTRRHIGGISLG